MPRLRALRGLELCPAMPSEPAPQLSECVPDSNSARSAAFQLLKVRGPCVSHVERQHAPPSSDFCGSP